MHRSKMHDRLNHRHASKPLRARALNAQHIFRKLGYGMHQSLAAKLGVSRNGLGDIYQIGIETLLR
jgi:hypothetical protein